MFDSWPLVKLKVVYAFSLFVYLYVSASKTQLHTRNKRARAAE
jgi:hypothetical protein